MKSSEVDGAYVVEIVSDSPADTFLQLGDLIVEVEGTKVESPKDLGDAIKPKNPRDSKHRIQKNGRNLPNSHHRPTGQY